MLALVPKLSPAAQQDPATTGSGIVDRLQAGAAKLVASSAPIPPATIAAPSSRASPRRRCATIFNEARRELNTLAPADRAAAQAWLDKADARDAALAASRQFAATPWLRSRKPAQ